MRCINYNNQLNDAGKKAGMNVHQYRLRGHPSKKDKIPVFASKPPMWAAGADWLEGRQMELMKLDQDNEMYEGDVEDED